MIVIIIRFLFFSEIVNKFTAFIHMPTLSSFPYRGIGLFFTNHFNFNLSHKQMIKQQAETVSVVYCISFKSKLKHYNKNCHLYLSPLPLTLVLKFTFNSTLTFYYICLLDSN